MIEKVRTIWIIGYLEKSLFQEKRILLGLSERPDAVLRPLDLLVKLPDQGERPLPPGTQAVDVYDAMDQALLILGAPGSGKTTLLLELARDLLTRANDDSVHPIPVIFPLSTWAETRKPLVEWLQDELNLRYDVPRKIAQEWVASDQVLPLLDALDEVKAEYRPGCVEAINAFRQSHGLLPLVVTSRTADYEALAEPLRLQGAILVQPLTREQVNAYLTELGPAGEPVGTALHEDPSLWELMDSPLLLSLITMTHLGQMEVPPTMSGTVAERRDRLFESYVSEVLHRGTSNRSYTPEQTAHWLSWLAYQMANHGQTVFYLERLQRDWLPKKQRWAIQVSTVLICVLVAGLVLGLVFGLVFGLVVGQLGELVFGLVSGLVVGLVVGPLVGLVAGLVLLSREIVCVETVRWSWSRCWRSWPSILFVGLFVGLVMVLVVGPVAGRVIGPVDGPVTGEFVAALVGPFIAVVFGLIAGLIAGLVRGLTFSRIETRAVPNEGIHRSARSALFVGLVYGLLGGLFGGLLVGLFVGAVVGLVAGLVFGLSIGLVVGLVGGLFSGLVAGGEACIKHVALRLWLIRNGSTPWNYVKFLDHAAERILLRKVGGGYVFLHRMLLEYFAGRYVEPGIGTKATAKSAGLEDAV